MDRLARVQKHIQHHLAVAPNAVAAGEDDPCEDTAASCLPTCLTPASPRLLRSSAPALLARCAVAPASPLLLRFLAALLLRLRRALRALFCADRVPIVVGVGRVVKGPAQGFAKGVGTTPCAIAAEAAAEAAEDSGAGEAILKRVTAVGMPMLAADPARAKNPPWLVQHLLGDVFEAAHHYGGAGSSGQLYVNDYATQIASGRMSGVALVVHGEAAHSVKQIDKEAAAKILEETPEPPSRPASLRITDMPQINPGEEEQQRQEML